MKHNYNNEQKSVDEKGTLKHKNQVFVASTARVATV